MDLDFQSAVGDEDVDQGEPQSKGRKRGPGQTAGAAVAGASAAIRGGGKLDQQEFDKLKAIVVMLAKMGLQAQQQIRLLRSVIIACMLCRDTHEALICTKEATKLYSDKAKLIKDVEKRQKAMSVPHTHRWNALVKWLLNQKLPTHMKQTVEAYIKSMVEMKMGFRAYEKHVKVCKVAKAFNKGFVKLEVSVVSGSSAEAVFDILTETMVQQGCRSLPGQAPPGYFEDQVQEWLESMKESGGGGEEF
jgi:hypothetical protein